MYMPQSNRGITPLSTSKPSWHLGHEPRHANHISWQTRIQIEPVSFDYRMYLSPPLFVIMASNSDELNITNHSLQFLCNLQPNLVVFKAWLLESVGIVILQSNAVFGTPRPARLDKLDKMF